jgi:hypothetical protein
MGLLGLALLYWRIVLDLTDHLDGAGPSRHLLHKLHTPAGSCRRRPSSEHF